MQELSVLSVNETVGLASKMSASGYLESVSSNGQDKLLNVENFRIELSAATVRNAEALTVNREWLNWICECLLAFDCKIRCDRSFSDGLDHT